MGKAGERQKRRPRLKDKKQSERFKEAARLLGADDVSDDQIERIMKALVDMKPTKRKGN